MIDKSKTVAQCDFQALVDDRKALRELVQILMDIPLIAGDVSKALAIARGRLHDLCDLIGDGR